MLSFLPDAPESTPDILVDVEAIPTPRGYAGVPSQVTAGYAALAAACNGGSLLYRLDGATRLILGTQAALYEGSGGTYTDVSRGGAYTTGDAQWRFAQFGNTSLAISTAIQLQYSNSGAFANVANAPKAALMESVGGFIMLFNCDDTGTGLTTGFGAQEARWWCSPIFAPTTSWMPSVPTQCTSGLLVASPGPGTALKRLGDAIVAYKARSMYVGQYVGGNAVWQWALVPGEIGVANNENVVSIGVSHFFIGFEDIYQFDGSRPVSIGAGVKEFFFARLNKTYAYKIQGAHDFQNQCVWWHYPSGGSTTLDSVLIYNYRTQRWGHATMNIECSLTTASPGITYATLGNFFTDYDNLPLIAYDSPFFQGGAPLLSVVDTTHVLRTLTGQAVNSHVKTGFFGDDSVVSTCTRVRPRYGEKPTSATLTPYSEMALGDNPTIGAARAVNGNRFDVLQSARWHQFRVDFVGDFEIQAIIPSVVEAGGE